MSAPAHPDEPDALSSQVRDARAGDDAAFAALFRAHYADLCTFVYRLVRDRSAAEEVVQDLFARLCDRRAAIDPDAVTRAYLFVAARNLALNALRHDRLVRRWTEPVEHHELDVGDIAYDAAEYEDLVRLVRAALTDMPERARTVFLLSRQHQLRYEEIAQVLGLAPKTVESHMSRALRALRDALAEYLAPALLAAVGLGLRG